MKDNFAQHVAQTPCPATGSRQATHNVGSAMSSAMRAVCDHAVRRYPAMVVGGVVGTSMGTRLALACVGLKPFVPRMLRSALAVRC